MKLKNDLEGGPEMEFETAPGTQPEENLMPPVNAEQPMEVKQDEPEGEPIEETQE
jgi:hypothetical protein